jgi:iron complex outermembrane recepter protein
MSGRGNRAGVSRGYANCMSQHRRRVLPLLLFGLLPGAAGAQEPSPEIYDSITLNRDAPTPVGAEPEAAQIETIYVTARRKTEALEDVPISITVLDGAALGDAGLTLATDIQERVPGLVVSVPNARLTSYTIRGLGSSSANDGIESSVGLFLDGVYLGRQGLSVFDLVDLERVEILRGPQGTLFGKNTTAGAINIVTRPPDAERAGTVELNFGDFDNYQVRGSLNDALSDALFGRISGYVTQREGNIDNRFGGDALNTREKYGLRGQLLWKPQDGLSARVIAEFVENDEACCAFPLRAPVRPAVAARDAFMEYERVGTDPYARETDADQRTRSRMRQKALSTEVNWDVAESHRLVSISAVRDWYFLPLNDDGTSLHLASTSTPNEHRQLSQELRLDSSLSISIPCSACSGFARISRAESAWC